MTNIPSSRFSSASLIWLSALALTLTSLSCVTPYQKRGYMGGFCDLRIRDDIYSVSFVGSVVTGNETIERYLFRRAAEVTIESGHRYFVIMSERHDKRAYSVGHWGIRVPLNARETILRIQCFNEKPGEDLKPIDAVSYLTYNFPEVLGQMEAPIPECNSSEPATEPSQPKEEPIADTSAALPILAG